MGLRIPSGGPIVTLNAGSSSLRFAAFDPGGLRLLAEGKFERVGAPEGKMTFRGRADRDSIERAGVWPDHASCLSALESALEERGLWPPAAIAQRVVHGGPCHFEPTLVSPELVRELKQFESFAPNHLPSAISLMETVVRALPALPQVACFDTGFHRELPGPARLLPLPRRFLSKGVRRYGFHGLAFASVVETLESEGPLPGRLLLAHLGNGASLAAVRNGRCVDTTMGFTPAAGLVMSTRSGDLDPGLVSFFASTEGMDAGAFDDMVTHRSGLLGLSETSSDVRDLLEREGSDVRAAEALAVFCHQARKWIGAMTAVLGGIDMLVFSGGIGENSSVIRERVCSGFEYLGFQPDPELNRAHAACISREGATPSIRIVPADEERHMAGAAARLLGGAPALHTQPDLIS